MSQVTSIEDEYEHLLSQAQQKGIAELLANLHEKRQYPRCRTVHQSLEMTWKPKVSVVNVSVSGIAVLSDQPVATGGSISFTIDKLLHVGAEVLDCNVIGTETDPHKARYLLRCKFTDEEAGRFVMVRLVKLELHG